MKCAFSFLAVVGFVAASAGQETKSAGQSPLLQQGLLNKLRPQLEQIFVFAFDGPKLKLDRKGWGDAPKNGKPVLNINSVAGSPIETIFSYIRTQAGPLQHSSMSVSNRQREISFAGGAMNGRLRVQGELIRLELEETAAPHRSLELTDDGQGATRLLLSGEGDLILVQQTRAGACTVAAAGGGKSFIAQGDSFLALYKQHRQAVDAQVLPALHGLAVALIPSSATPQMKNAVLALLTRTPESLEEGKKLMRDLDSEKFQTRDKASKLLNERFEVYKDLIQEKLKDSTLSQETASRLAKIMAAHPDAQKVSQTIAALDLLRDPAYLVGILEEAAPEQRAKVAAQLEAVTGQRLGSEVAAWKRWLAEPKR
jgi:hypothetical protein